MRSSKDCLMPKQRGRSVPPVEVQPFPSDSAALDALVSLNTTAVPLRLIVLDRAQASATRPPEPVLFLDTSAHSDVETLLASHVEGRDGDVTVRWQVLTVHNEQRGAILYLDFAAPQACSFHVVFPFLYGPEDTTMAVQAMALHRHVQLTTAPIPAADADDPDQQHVIPTVNVGLPPYPAP